MYYSVVVETRDIFNPIYSFDKTDLDKIKKNVIKPFCRGEILFVNGQKLYPNFVECVRIFSHEKSIKSMVNDINSKLFYESKKTSEVQLIYDEKFATEVTDDVLEEVREELEDSIYNQNEKTNYDKKKIFIVHGHDEKLKMEVELFLTKLDLEPIILSDQANEGRTIIEKLEKYTDVGYGIVLYTACDKGGTKDTDFENMKFRARQNVIFEHGYLLAKLGRGKVCALLDGDVEQPSDINGVLYVSIKDNWKNSIIKELQAVGYDVDANKII